MTTSTSTNRELLNIVSEQPNLAFAVLQDLRFVYANQAIGTMTGYLPEELYALEPGEIRRTILPPMRDAIWSLAEETGGTGPSAQDLEFVFRHKDGSTRWLRLLAGPCNYGGRAALYLFLVEPHSRTRIPEAVGDAETSNDPARQLPQILQSLLKGEEELRCSRNQLRELTHHYQQLIEQERATIAKEVHDDLGQELTAMRMDLAWLRRQLTNVERPVSNRVDDLLRRSNQTLQRVQRLATQLRPSVLDQLGIAPALEWLVEDVSRWGQLTVSLTIKPEEPDFPKPLATATFRIAQEALTNVVRHAQATTAEVRLQREGHLWDLTVRDNGVGIAMRALDDIRAYGLQSMRERARTAQGRISLERLMTGGTLLRFTFPHGTA